MMFRSTCTGLIAFLAAICSSGGAQTMPLIIVTNKADSFVEIVPLDQAHASSVPSALEPILPSQPSGSFLIFNRTSTPITVIVTTWSFRDKSGNLKPHKSYCDSYLISADDALVKANDMALITPDGCIRGEYFAHMAAGKPMLGSRLPSDINQSLIASQNNLASVQISVDSVIFADGQIWGPDTLRYYPSIIERYIALQSVVKDLDAAKAAGEDMEAHLKSIEDEAISKRSRPANLRAQYADLVRTSPNREGTLKWLRERTPPPPFRHIGEQQP